MDLDVPYFNIEDVYHLIPPDNEGELPQEPEEQEEDGEIFSSDSSSSSGTSTDGDDGSDSEQGGGEGRDDEGDCDDILWAYFITVGIRSQGKDGKGQPIPEEDREHDEDFECECSSSSSSSSDSEDSECQPGPNGADQQDIVVPTFAKMNNIDSEAESSNDEDAENFDDNDNASPETKVYIDWCKEMKVDPKHREIEVITVESDEEEKEDYKGVMKCYRCPERGSNFTDRTLFLLHRERHKALSHFVCPTCLKPFVKLSYCFAHEVRIHDASFPSLQHPLVIAAVEYREKKKKEEEEEENANANIQETADAGDKPLAEEVNEESSDNESVDPSVFDDGVQRKMRKGAVIKNEEYAAHFAELVLFPDEETCELDEDDPRFCPDYMVPSTPLYPYRGPEPFNIYDCYEIQLRCPRNHRTAANTISRCVQARRRKLMAEGKISESDYGRFWKLEPPKAKDKSDDAKTILSSTSTSNSTISTANKDNSNSQTKPKRGRGAESVISKVSRVSKKRKRGEGPSDDENDSAAVNKKKRRRVRKKAPPKVNIESRDFVSGIIARSCLLCGTAWKNQLELEQHRNSQHAGRTLLELMTIAKPGGVNSTTQPQTSRQKEKETKEKEKPKKTSRSKERRKDKTETASTVTARGRRVRQKYADLPPSPKPTSDEEREKEEEEKLSPKERFLGTLGLVTIAKRDEILAKKPWPRGKFCYVRVQKISKPLRRGKKIWACSVENCNFYDTNKEQLRKHKRFEHGNMMRRNPTRSQQSCITVASSIRPSTSTSARSQQVAFPLTISNRSAPVPTNTGPVIVSVSGGSSKSNASVVKAISGSSSSSNASSSKSSASVVPNNNRASLSNNPVPVARKSTK